MQGDIFNSPGYFIQQLQCLTGLPESQVRSVLLQRGAADDDVLSQCEIAAGWVVELWRQERSQAAAAQLWHVDRKYTKILKSYTVADIVQLLVRRAAP